MADYTIAGTDTLTLEAVKKQLNVDFVEDNDFITGLIGISLSAVESYCRNVFLKRAYTQNIGVFDGTLPPMLTTDETSKPVGFVEIVYFTGAVETTLDVAPLTQYNLSDNHYYYINNYIVIVLKDSVPVDAYTSSHIKWNTGMDTIDTAINQARLLLCGTFYENRESVVMGTNSSDLPHGIKFLLEPYMYPQVG